MQESFESLGVAAELVSVLSKSGIVYPFPIQAMTIGDALGGRDLCGKAKTGSGKTLAFGIPLLMRAQPGRPQRPGGLVLVPTRELAVQVAKVLTPLAGSVGRKVACVYGGVALERQVNELSEGADVVVATPGRLIDLLERSRVDLGSISVLVLDEADRMADMGFMPQVEWLMRRIPSDRQTMLFSATLDGEVDGLIRHYLRDPVRHDVGGEQPTVEGMQHLFFSVHEMDKDKVAAALVARARKAIVFVRTKRGATQVARSLASAGVRSAAIHGDLRQRERQKSLDDFTSGRLGVLVATDVAARGLDIESVNVVLHYDPAEDHKTYLHRSGRTARAGGHGVAVTLVLWNQLLEVERVQRRLGLDVPVDEVFSNDPRLAEVASVSPDAA